MSRLLLLSTGLSALSLVLGGILVGRHEPAWTGYLGLLIISVTSALLFAEHEGRERVRKSTDAVVKSQNAYIASLVRTAASREEVIRRMDRLIVAYVPGATSILRDKNESGETH